MGDVVFGGRSEAVSEASSDGMYMSVESLGLSYTMVAGGDEGQVAIHSECGGASKSSRRGEPPQSPKSRCFAMWSLVRSSGVPSTIFVQEVAAGIAVVFVQFYIRGAFFCYIL